MEKCVAVNRTESQSGSRELFADELFADRVSFLKKRPVFISGVCH